MRRGWGGAELRPGRDPPPLGAQATGASRPQRLSGRIVWAPPGFSPVFPSPPWPCWLPRGRLRLVSGRGRSFLSSAREGFLLTGLSLLHFSVPNAATASCHRSSSQHGGGGSGVGRRRPQLPERKPGTRGAYPHLLASATPALPLADTMCVTMESTLEHHGKCSTCILADFEATPLLVTVARKGKLAFVHPLPRSQVCSGILFEGK